MFVKHAHLPKISETHTIEDLRNSVMIKLLELCPDTRHAESTSLWYLLSEMVAIVKKPILFFLDDHPADEQLLTYVCSQMNSAYNAVSTCKHPFFGFLLAGRRLGELNLSRETSMRLHWILLHSFSKEDVKFIVSSLVTGVCPALPNVHKLISNDNLQQFTDMLFEASGGIALHMYQVSFRVLI